MKHKLFVIFLSLLSFGWSVAAQKTGTVYTVVGQVVDSLSNETVPYATLNFALSNAPQKSVQELQTFIYVFTVFAYS